MPYTVDGGGTLSWDGTIAGGAYGDKGVLIDEPGAPILGVAGTTAARLMLVHTNAPANVKVIEIRAANGLLDVQTNNDAATSAQTLTRVDGVSGSFTVRGAYLYVTDGVANGAPADAAPVMVHHTGPLTRAQAPQAVVHVWGVAAPGTTGANDGAGLGGRATVRGQDGAGNAFVDEIVFSRQAVVVLASLPAAGSPASRTYDVVNDGTGDGTQVRLSLAAGTYTVFAATYSI